MRKFFVDNQSVTHPGAQYGIDRGDLPFACCEKNDATSIRCRESFQLIEFQRTLHSLVQFFNVYECSIGGYRTVAATGDNSLLVLPVQRQRIQPQVLKELQGSVPGFPRAGSQCNKTGRLCSSADLLTLPQQCGRSP